MKKIFILFAFFSLCFGLNKDEIKSVMSQNLNQAVQIIQNKAITDSQKPQKLFEIFDDIFDYKQMAKISLSKRYKTLKDDEKAKFDKAYEKQLKISFTNKLKGYTDQTIKILDLEFPKQNRANLKTEILSKGKSYPIIFKFYPKQDNWLIYDVDVLGVSIVQAYRSQFGDILENGTFDELIKKLQETKLPDDK